MKRNEAYFILIATFIVVVVWIALAILDSAISSTIPKSLNTQILAISPTFNTRIIDELKNRKQVSPLNATFENNQASQSATPVSFVIQGPSPTPQIATNSGNVEQQQTP